MGIWQIVLVGGAAFCGGAMNAVAGGGTFFSFPALLAVGVSPVVANATNSVGLCPASLSGAWAYRKELARYKRYLLPLSVAALVGGVGGSLLLLVTREATFAKLIPWLLLFATVLFAGSRKIAEWLRGKDAGAPSGGIAVLAAQTVVAVYGGFFGAGLGILNLAMLAMAGHKDVHDLNAMKNLLSAVVYSVTVLVFVLAGSIDVPYTLLMAVMSMLGAYGGATAARRIPALWLRRFIITVGFLLTAVYFYKTY